MLNKPRSKPGDKPLRADAERNRQRVLQVAELVFASQGMAVPIDEIARRAKLGVGTVYRHFPTKEALIEAVSLRRLGTATDETRALCSAADAGAAFFELLARLLAEGLAKRDLTAALAQAGSTARGPASSKRAAFRAALGALLTRAQAHGAVRKDVGVAEILALMAGAFAAQALHRGDPRARAKLFEVVCDGLRRH
ncbi:MAG: Transcriptional regulator, TetR family [Myxococcaceae bacterium]|nr:Transcriptional regulator, TetR family [Myxococcaceae bacterium]